MQTFIKICGDPFCTQIHHNTPKVKTRCLNCDGRLIIINLLTYKKKYVNWYFQIDYNTQNYYYPILDIAKKNPL